MNTSLRAAGRKGWPPRGATAQVLGALLACAWLGAGAACGAEAPAFGKPLSEDARKEVQALVARLTSPEAQERASAEQALPKFGPAVRALLEPLLASDHKDAAAAAARLLALPALATDLPRVRIVLERGTIELVLFEDDAPNSVAHFIALAEKKFYDGLAFYRVVEQFAAQAGDPAGTGRSGAGYRIADEIDADALGLDKRTAGELGEQTGRAAPAETAGMTLKDLYRKQGFTYVSGLKSHPVKRGALALFGPRPNANSSAFFIAQIDCPWLDGRHTVLGEVTQGLNWVDALKQGEKMLRVEVLYKRAHPYVVKKLEEK